MRVQILRGIPGSGKSHHAQQLVEKGPHGLVEVVSADHWFTKDGVYRFKPAELPQAHGQCLLRYVETMKDWQSLSADRLVIVDNTNVEAWEIAPYYSLAQAHGYEVEVLTFNCPVETAVQRQTHGVPEDTIRRMHDRIQKATLPWIWQRRSI